MIAAPGWSIFPSSVAVEPARAARAPVAQQLQHARVARVGRRPGLEHGGDRAKHLRAREVLGRCLVHRGDHDVSVSVCFAARRSFDRVLEQLAAVDRAIAPVAVRGRETAAGLLFQFTITPLPGLIWCGCARAGRKPRHSYWPVPSVGRPGSTLRGAHGQPSARVHRDVAVVRVEPVEGELDLRHRVDEALGGVDAVRVQVGERQRVDAARARASSASARSRLACRPPSRSRSPGRARSR